jgi:BirA family transcriptional regulator, biotin operon repressor / biotin---[acetyl-CoA-carboxylase] ligase
LEPRHSLLPLAVALAVCETAERLRPEIECKVKWPNDVHLDGRKLAGILIEARPQDGWAVLGIGLNLTIAQVDFPPELRDRATSLFPPDLPHPEPSLALSRPTGPYNRQNEMRSGRAREASATLSECLAEWLDAGEQRVLNAWRKRDALLGSEVTWEQGTGVAEGIDERGYLIVRVADGDRVTLGAGDVHLTAF